MTHKLYEHTLSFFLACILTGCMAIQAPIGPGDILPVGAGQVLYGIQQAVAAKPGTALLGDPTGQHFLAAWPCAGAQCWAFISQTAEGFFENVSGNIAQVKTWGELKGTLDALKWAPVMPVTLAEVLGQRAVAVISRVLSAPILVVPAMLDPVRMIQPQTEA